MSWNTFNNSMQLTVLRTAVDAHRYEAIGKTGPTIRDAFSCQTRNAGAEKSEICENISFDAGA